MSDGQGKKYDTNPLDQEVYERAEAQMGDGTATDEHESPTRPMHPGDGAPYDTDPQGMPRATGPYPQSMGAGAATYGRPEPAAYMPPQQAAYQTPPAQAPYQQAWTAQMGASQQQIQPVAGTSSFASRGSAHFGLQPNFAAMLCYLPFLGIVTSVVLNQVEPPENRFVRFHAKQGMFAHIAFWAIAVAFTIGRAAAPTPVSILILLSQIFYYFGAVAGFVMMMMATYRGEWKRIPIIGEQVRE